MDKVPNIFSQMVGNDGDESQGTIEKHLKKQIQESWGDLFYTFMI